MSRIAKQPVSIPSGVTLTLNNFDIQVKGPKGTLSRTINSAVKLQQHEDTLQFSVIKENRESWAQAGTARALVQNMVTGVSTGFTKKLQLIGVGYRAQCQGSKVTLTVGYSHPVVIDLPEGVSASMEGQTELTLSSIDKQVVGQIAAEIRAIRPPEPYKGKGIRYADEYVKRKEAKKK